MKRLLKTQEKELNKQRILEKEIKKLNALNFYLEVNN